MPLSMNLIWVSWASMGHCRGNGPPVSVVLLKLYKGRQSQACPRSSLRKNGSQNFTNLRTRRKPSPPHTKHWQPARRRMPMTLVEKDYRFLDPKGEMSLPDLFAGRQQLILYRFFYEPGVADWPTGAARRRAMLRPLSKSYREQGLPAQASGRRAPKAFRNLLTFSPCRRN